MAGGKYFLIKSDVVVQQVHVVRSVSEDHLDEVNTVVTVMVRMTW